MRFALLAGDETADDLRELVTNLRARQRRAVIASVRDELGEDIDEVLDLLGRADAVGAEQA